MWSIPTPFILHIQSILKYCKQQWKLREFELCLTLGCHKPHNCVNRHYQWGPENIFAYLCQVSVLWQAYGSCYDSPLFFSFLMITHPFHVIGPLTTLVFIIASFHPFPQTSLTHSCLLICTSLQFHHIPPCFFCFVIVLELSESQVYKPSTCYLLP